jgi:hypothetical protein
MRLHTKNNRLMIGTSIFVGDQSRHVIDVSCGSLHVDRIFAANLQILLQK